MRLLILAALAYIAWRALKSWLAGGAVGGRTSNDAADVLDDVMVQDPQCGVYFPKREGVRHRSGGQDLYFCSEKCLNRHIQTQKENG